MKDDTKAISIQFIMKLRYFILFIIYYHDSDMISISTILMLKGIRFETG